jgi:hypothetical protein
MYLFIQASNPIAFILNPISNSFRLTLFIVLRSVHKPFISYILSLGINFFSIALEIYLIIEDKLCKDFIPLSGNLVAAIIKDIKVPSVKEKTAKSEYSKIEILKI